MKTLNEVFTALSMRRRYEVWFLRLGLGDGSGAWWFRYLLMNPGRGGCAGRIEVAGQRISWDLRYRSSFRAELSGKGWIGFSRTPHSDAVFSGEIALNDRSFRGEPLR